MLSLHTNAASLSTQNSLASTNKALSSSMTKLGTGFRVNSAMDDAAGLQIATRLNAQTRGMQVAQKNTQNGISMMQTAEGALSEVTNILLRMKDLATEGATASATADDKKAMQAEFAELGKELTNIMKNTTFGGEKIFGVGDDGDAVDGNFATAMTFQIGADKEETMEVNVSELVKGLTADNGTLGELSVAYKTDADFSDPTDPDKWTIGSEITTSANETIEKAEAALAAVSELRSALGAASNRLEHTFNNLGNMIQNTNAAKGRIMDVDYATETSNMTSKQMLMQASTSMLKQSNSMSQMVASLLQ